VVIGEVDRPARPETFELIRENFEDWCGYKQKFITQTNKERAYERSNKNSRQPEKEMVFIDK